jgi:thiamine biosynthesis lipoprotein
MNSSPPIAQAPARPAAAFGKRCFFAMNTDVTLLVADWQRLPDLEPAEQLFHEFERRFSRFLDASELSKLNANSGTEFEVSAQMIEVLTLCQRLNRITGGIFEPAILPGLEFAGYDRSFELLGDKPRQLSSSCQTRGGSVRDIVISRKLRTIRMAGGLRVDLGGIGKGFAVDKASAILRHLNNFLVDAGGDLYAAGEGPGGLGWPVGVANPLAENRPIATVNVRDLALATSTVTRRRWSVGGSWNHHLIDPRTGAPAESDLISVSVLAPTASEADVFAKTALIMGSAAGRRFLEQQECGGLLLKSDASWLATDHWPASSVPGMEVN